MDYRYLVLNETILEDLEAFKALHSGWQSWLKSNDIKLREYSVWGDSQGHGYTAQLFKSLAEIEENQNNFRAAVAKYRSLAGYLWFLTNRSPTPLPTGYRHITDGYRQVTDGLPTDH